MNDRAKSKGKLIFQNLSESRHQLLKALEIRAFSYYFSLPGNKPSNPVG